MDELPCQCPVCISDRLAGVDVLLARGKVDMARMALATMQRELELAAEVLAEFAPVGGDARDGQRRAVGSIKSTTLRAASSTNSTTAGTSAPTTKVGSGQRQDVRDRLDGLHPHHPAGIAQLGAGDRQQGQERHQGTDVAANTPLQPGQSAKKRKMVRRRLATRVWKEGDSAAPRVQDRGSKRGAPRKPEPSPTTEPKLSPKPRRLAALLADQPDLAALVAEVLHVSMGDVWDLAAGRTQLSVGQWRLLRAKLPGFR